MAEVEVIKASEGTVNRRRNIVGSRITFERKRVAAYRINPFILDKT